MGTAREAQALPVATISAKSTHPLSAPILSTKAPHNGPTTMLLIAGRPESVPNISLLIPKSAIKAGETADTTVLAKAAPNAAQQAPQSRARWPAVPGRQRAWASAFPTTSSALGITSSTSTCGVCVLRRGGKGGISIWVGGWGLGEGTPRTHTHQTAFLSSSMSTPLSVPSMD